VSFYLLEQPLMRLGARHSGSPGRSGRRRSAAR
jgi:hypothetical protein